MNIIILTDCIISKGFEGKPAFRFNENKSAVNFKIGKRVYDKNAKDNHRYINIAAKAFGTLCERIEKMQLKEGSRINITGSLDEEQWEDKGQKLSRFVIIVEKIEYASSDSGKSNGNGNGTGSAPQAPPVNQNQQNSSGDQTGTPPNFNGFDNFGNGEESEFF